MKTCKSMTSILDWFDWFDFCANLSLFPLFREYLFRVGERYWGARKDRGAVKEECDIAVLLWLVWGFMCLSVSLVRMNTPRNKLLCDPSAVPLCTRTLKPAHRRITACALTHSWIRLEASGQNNWFVTVEAKHFILLLFLDPVFPIGWALHTVFCLRCIWWHPLIFLFNDTKPVVPCFCTVLGLPHHRILEFWGHLVLF